MSKKLIAVIHIISNGSNSYEAHCLKQATIAFENGAFGVFLTIGEIGITNSEIISCYEIIRNQYPSKFIGINFMCDPILAIRDIPITADAIWIDKGIGSTTNFDALEQIKSALVEKNWNGLHFGGFYFKGNNGTIKYDDSFYSICKNINKYMDIATTSGPGTGVGIELERLIMFNKSLGSPLALASGITASNIESFVPYAEYFIVGTGIEIDSRDNSIIEFFKSAGLENPVEVGYLDSEKIKRIVNILTNYN
jgi:hypothetical protein